MDKTMNEIIIITGLVVLGGLIVLWAFLSLLDQSNQRIKGLKQ